MQDDEIVVHDMLQLQDIDHNEIEDIDDLIIFCY